MGGEAGDWLGPETSVREADLPIGAGNCAAAPGERIAEVPKSRSPPIVKLPVDDRLGALPALAEIPAILTAGAGRSAGRPAPLDRISVSHWL